MMFSLRRATFLLAKEHPEFMDELFPLLREASDPKYRSYVEEKRKKNEKPLDEKDWEVKVFGKDEDGEKKVPDVKWKGKCNKSQCSDYGRDDQGTEYWCWIGGSVTCKTKDGYSANGASASEAWEKANRQRKKEPSADVKKEKTQPTKKEPEKELHVDKEKPHPDVSKTNPSSDADKAKPLVASKEALREYGAKFDNSSLNGVMRAKLLKYSKEGYKPLNDFLRKGIPTKEVFEKEHPNFLRSLDKAFQTSAARVPEPVVVSRVMSTQHKIAKMLANGELEIGSIVEDEGFVSTTIIPPTANFKDFGFTFADLHADVMLEISVPTGAKGIYIGQPCRGGCLSHSNEWELLLNRGTKMKVTGVGKDRIKLEVINEG